ncbi:hypothetical protein PHYPSEUDO_006048 [Phytophthora pseudosyringae]|uniref:Amino Acid-Polyamine-Organocation (APC) Family n=1 Tax=Phytophthora pseudosyringae TaxID=221518 RepID=A0A8T1VMV1_9STRA|nr:hypothetical protein PHYPSEUDO_006048 [Phytophthora pseudosyringae]
MLALWKSVMSMQREIVLLERDHSCTQHQGRVLSPSVPAVFATSVLFHDAERSLVVHEGLQACVDKLSNLTQDFLGPKTSQSKREACRATRIQRNGFTGRSLRWFIAAPVFQSIVAPRVLSCAASRCSVQCVLADLRSEPCKLSKSTGCLGDMEAALSPKAGGAYERLQLTPSLEKLRDPSVVSGMSSQSAAEMGETAIICCVLRPRSRRSRKALADSSKSCPSSACATSRWVGAPELGSTRGPPTLTFGWSSCGLQVCGGPIGSEYIISAGDPLVGFILLLLFPFIFGIPIAYVTAELSTTFPQDGGYTVWVLNAFGPFWVFQCGYQAWVSGVIGNAIYPALAVATFTDMYGSIDSSVGEYFVKAAIALALALPNLVGIRIVGRGMAVMSIFVMIPFAVLCIWGMINANDWGAVGEVRLSDIVYDANGEFVSMSGSINIDWSLLINTLFWNFNGAVGMSVFGGEVTNPGYTYPRALLISVLLVALTYLAPLFGATVFNSPQWTPWGEGSFSSIAEDIGGSFLSNWFVLATFCSNAGMYIAELFCDSFQILGMAECGLAPAFLKARNKRFNTPHNAVFASLVIILVLIRFEFDEILGRFSQPDTERPFNVPRRVAVQIVALQIPTGLLIYIAVDVFFTLVPALLVVGVTLAGLLYARWRKFTRAQFRQLATNTEA